MCRQLGALCAGIGKLVLEPFQLSGDSDDATRSLVERALSVVTRARVFVAALAEARVGARALLELDFAVRDIVFGELDFAVELMRVGVGLLDFTEQQLEFVF